MSPPTLYAVSSVALLLVAVFGLLTSRNLVRRVIAINLVGSGVFLLLVAIAERGAGAPDPIPHALVLTGIVVSVSTTALALALIRRIHSATGRLEFEDAEPEGPA